jgi:signal transduction histidine kinase
MNGLIIGAMSLALDITESRRAEQELRDSQRRLRNLARHLNSVRETERGAIARVIHDELGQTLTGMKMNLCWVQRQLTEKQEALASRIASTSQQIDAMVERVQQISTELRPGILDELGLVAAIEWQIEQLQDRTETRCELHVHPKELRVEPALATALFRIVQEALTNVVRHAGAKTIRTHLIRAGDRLELEVRDDGCGISDERLSDPRSFGLIGMRERVNSWGGELEIIGQPGRGTTVRVVVPWPANAENSEAP